MTTLFSFIFVLGVLVFIHELGHFLVAKRVGIRVEKFSLGFPPYIFSRAWGETTYCIGIVPLGGFVKMAGENPEEESTGAPDEFMSKTVLQRAAVIFAGPFMNYVLAIFLMSGIYFFSGEPVVDPDRMVVGQVSAESPAEQVGIQPDDVILRVDDSPIGQINDLRDQVSGRPNELIEIVWLRGVDTMSAALTTMIHTQPNAQGGLDSIGMIGVGQRIEGYRSYGVWESASTGFKATNRMVDTTLSFLKQVVTRKVSLKMMGGPLFIAQQSGRSAEAGGGALFFFMAFLSVNLAILNVLPIPVLDGGHLVFLFIEKIKGSPLTMKARVAAQQVGLVVLLALIVMVTYNDIMRFIRGF